MIKEKIDEFVKRADELRDIDKANRRNAGFVDLRNNMPSGINQWMSEIKLFNERYLKTHPLYKDIDSVCFHNKGQYSDYNKMVGLLKALQNDDEIEKESENKLTYQPVVNSLKDMLENDIMQCQVFLENPQDEASGKDLYIAITSQYDNVIKNFGNGLYSYHPEQHFYDSDISVDIIKYNMNILLQKMITYHTINFEDKKNMTSNLSNNKVFIVHGHDNEAVQETARFIEKLGLKAIILHEQPSSGDTIIEKIEHYADVGFAIILYTPCDEGKSIKDDTFNYRARQNVVFEHGYLIGKLSRKRVCALVKNQVETPGDISGVVYISMDNAGAWKYQLIDEMNHVEFNLNKNLI